MLAGLFDPASIVVVGASANPDKWGFQYARQLLAGAHRRRVYLVNAKGEPVLGQPTYRHVEDLPEAPEVAVLCVPRDAIADAVEAGCRLGTRLFVCITAGFGETSTDGARLQQRLVDTVRHHGARLVGPNCVGLFDATAELSCTAFWDLPAGSIAMVSQSGGLIVELGDRLPAYGLGFSKALSIGNQADVTIADAVHTFVDDPATTLVAAYIEDVHDGRAVLKAFARAVSAGKPVVALVPGASEAVARAVASHTASLVSADDMVDAAFAQVGALRVRSMADFMLAVRGAAAPVRLGPRRRVAVMADGGGGATIATDAAVREGLAVPAFDPALTEAVRAVATPGSGVGNPVDLVGALDLEAFVPVIEAVTASGTVDAIVLSGILKNFNPTVDPARERQVAAHITDLAVAAGVALAVSTNLPDEPAMAEFTARGIPVVDDPTFAARCLVMGQARQVGRPVPEPGPPATTPMGDDGYFGARAFFADAGVPFPAAAEVSDRDAVLAAAERIGHPVVLKALHASHKSDGGGVVLGLADAGAVAAAFDDMHLRLASPTYSVEAMATIADAVEMIVGAVHDAHFGPTITVGFGGTLSELLRDTATALAPIDRAATRELLAGLRGVRLLTGYRNRPPVDLDALADVMVAVADAVAAHPELAEAELNPVLVGPAGVLALDARIVLTRP